MPLCLKYYHRSAMASLDNRPHTVHTLGKVTGKGAKIVGLLLPSLADLHHITEVVSHTSQQARTTVDLSAEVAEEGKGGEGRGGEQFAALHVYIGNTSSQQIFHLSLKESKQRVLDIVSSPPEDIQRL